ncbi:MAG TPA: hypothetical protein VD859_17080 [Nocardioides sp.]|nr:hypothetical protein [Nocardioides sp.]
MISRRRTSEPAVPLDGFLFAVSPTPPASTAGPAGTAAGPGVLGLVGALLARGTRSPA